LAGGFLQPIEPERLKSAITKALCADLGELDTIMRALALPEIAACRSRLVPEITVFSANTDDHSATYVGGLPMRPAYHTGIIDLVIDWKTDVGPSPQHIGLYSEQMPDHLVATGAPEGLLVFVTTGRLVRIRPQF
jgi:exodeoxyribonuclease-5